MHSTVPPQLDLSPSRASENEAARIALRDLLSRLEQLRYDFTAPTPATHARIVGRPDRRLGRSEADLLGWSLPCSPDDIDVIVLECLARAGAIEDCGHGLIRAKLRVSRIFERLFVHSPYPTSAIDAVFLGPDSHRFADFIQRNIADLPEGCRVLDYGAGAGVGGITAASMIVGASLTLADINTDALAMAAINAEVAGLDWRTAHARSPADLQGMFDLIVTHPPFMMDEDHRFYRDGGDLNGARLSFEWVLDAIPKLAPGGRLLMHTGVSIVHGEDVLRSALEPRLQDAGLPYEYRVLDPDIFGEELEKAVYAQVERIAAIGLRIDMTTPVGSGR